MCIRVLSACLLLGGLSSFRVSFIGGFTVLCKNPRPVYMEMRRLQNVVITEHAQYSLGLKGVVKKNCCFKIVERW